MIGDRHGPGGRAADRHVTAQRTAAAPGGGRIALHGVNVSFPAAGRQRVVAVDAVDLDVEAGQIVSIIGPNGGGKSTLLRVIAGLLRPDHGEALLDGQPIRGPDPRVSLVFQEPRLLPWRSAARNVAYPMELAGWDRARRDARVTELVRVVGLAGAEDRIPAELSGGMRQRAALARALALEPRVLLLDEPFSALDALTRERFNVELLGLWGRTHPTVVVVTHSIQEAIFLGDRVVVLGGRPGRVVADLPIQLPRPRTLGQLDDAVVSAAAHEIRAHLDQSVAS